MDVIQIIIYDSGAFKSFSHTAKVFFIFFFPFYIPWFFFLMFSPFLSLLISYLLLLILFLLFPLLVSFFQDGQDPQPGLNH